MSAPNSGWEATKKNLLRNWQLYVLVIPAVVYFLIFLYWPMYGVIIAFKDFSPGKGIWGSPWASVKGGDFSFFGGKQKGKRLLGGDF